MGKGDLQCFIMFFFLRLKIIENVTSKKRGSWHVLEAERPIELMTTLVTCANNAVKFLTQSLY